MATLAITREARVSERIEGTNPWDKVKGFVNVAIDYVNSFFVTTGSGPLNSRISANITLRDKAFVEAYYSGMTH